MLLRSTSQGPGVTDVERVRAAIRTLPPAERDVLVLRFAAGLGTDEVAAVLGTSPAIVRRRLHHAGWVVEDLAGISPADGSAHGAQAGRSAAMVEEEASVGITPLLAARLVAAVTGEPPAADDHWRLHAVVRGLRARSEGVLTTLLVASVALPTAMSLAPYV